MACTASVDPIGAGARITYMRRSALAFALVLAVFLALDAVWLTLAADSLYRPAIGHLMREGFDGAAAALFYLLYGCAMVGFVILPARTTREALLRGACFGLVAYATYDLTNQATMRDWPWHVTLADLAWGSFATGVSCAIACWLLRAVAAKR
jgi:uncharacterized membrane protein